MSISYYIHNNSNVSIPKETCYILTKKGIMLQKIFPLIESAVLISKINTTFDLPDLLDYKEYALMHIPKIPLNLFCQILSFFRWVEDVYHCEAVSILDYNPDKKLFKILIPDQQVSSASVNYELGAIDSGYKRIGTIHSHSSMPAFHSGVDTDNEKNFDGIHITIGNVNDDNFSLSSTIASNGFRLKVDPVDYIEGLLLIENKIKENKIEEKDNEFLGLDEYLTGYNYNFKNYKSSYQTGPRYNLQPHKKGFNSKWMNKIVKQPIIVFKGGYKDWENRQRTKGIIYGNNNYERKYPKHFEMNNPGSKCSIESLKQYDNPKSYQPGPGTYQICKKCEYKALFDGIDNLGLEGAEFI